MTEKQALQTITLGFALCLVILITVMVASLPTGLAVAIIGTTAFATLTLMAAFVRVVLRVETKRG